MLCCLKFSYEYYDYIVQVKIKDYRRVARIFVGGGGEGAYFKNRDQIMNVLNDTLC